MSTEENKAIVRRAIEEGFNKGNLGIADEIFTADYTVHAPGLGNLPKGPQAFKKAIGMWRAAFPDIKMEIQDMIAEGDRVVNRFITRGTHKADLMGVPATGKPITVYGMECHRIVGGKVAESWIGDDVPTIMNQIKGGGRPAGGPPPGAAGGPPPGTR